MINNMNSVEPKDTDIHFIDKTYERIYNKTRATLTCNPGPFIIVTIYLILKVL